MQLQQHQHKTLPGPPISAQRAALVIGRLTLDYWLDWAGVVVCAIVLAATDPTAPRDAFIRKDTLPSLSGPLLPNSVPSWSVPVIAIVLPALVMIAYTLPLKRRPSETHHLLLGLLAAVLFTGALTNAIKGVVGRPRPNFIARCWPDGQVAWSSGNEWGGYAACTGAAAVVAEGRKSFPSGHSSWTASGLGYLSFFFLDKLTPFDGNGHPWRLLLSSAPILGALGTGISRYVDYWHFPSDIITGLALGFVISFVVYHQQRLRIRADELAAVQASMRADEDVGSGLLIERERNALLPV